MISCIICSRKADIPIKLRKNIEETIGENFEIIVIDNSENQYSIFSAYNEGANRAKGEILCFMHEDILYHTDNWGKKILTHFNDTSIGLIGFAGTHFLPSVPIYWFSSPFISEYNLTNDNGIVIRCEKKDFFKGRNIVDVVACDGFCFFVRKLLLEKISFDDKTFSGFHFYDMDICMQVLSLAKRVCICNDVLIEHEWSEKSMENIENEFKINNQLFFDKWKDKFFISRGIQHIPFYVLDRIDRLFRQVYDNERIRKSKSYRLGKFLLSPLKKIIK